MHYCMLISLRVWQALRSSDTPHRRDFLPAFTRNQVTKPFPAWRRFMVAQRQFPGAPALAGRLWQRAGSCDWVEGGSCTPQRPA